MNNLSIKGTMSSREIAQIAGRPHNDVLKSIRKMERSWRNVTG
ncbi:phage regulatory protein/antirepressor Ant, partial [Ornithobacterium rhinotracheale]|nr:phage regulatory protein/antirepressor Ant [Ornithobacterium rhinotracheale]MRJ09471.1 phage regulatory protein/antirepressor Ant [Ornithobacterium rhinotracheale]